MDRDYKDQLAPWAHLLYRDWDEAISRQSASLAGILDKQWPDRRGSILDASCGIGTRVIGLVRTGLNARGQDDSEITILRAREAARQRGLEVDFRVSGMCPDSGTPDEQPEVIVCCENAILTLGNDDEMLKVLSGFRNALPSGGGCLLSLEDLAQAANTAGSRNHGVREEAGVRYRMFENRNQAGDRVEISLSIVSADGKGPEQIRVFNRSLRAIGPSRLAELMRDAGFSRVMQVERQFFQPLVIGTA